jgi:hypothetical protein
MNEEYNCRILNMFSNSLIKCCQNPLLFSNFAILFFSGGCKMNEAFITADIKFLQQFFNKMLSKYFALWNL